MSGVTGARVALGERVFPNAVDPWGCGMCGGYLPARVRRVNIVAIVDSSVDRGGLRS